MKTLLVSIGFVFGLAAAVVAGFFLGAEMQVRSLRDSGRNPARLEMQIATLEVENRTLVEQVGDLQRQVEAGVKGQADKAAQLAVAEAEAQKARDEVEALRARADDSKKDSAAVERPSAPQAQPPAAP